MVTLAAVFAPGAASMAVAAAEPGDAVYIGAKEGYPGTGIFPIWVDGSTGGDPDYWAYCIEHDVSAKTRVPGSIGDFGDYLGENHFADPEVQGKVLWILAHSYPAVSLEEFGAAAGVPNISRDDAIEATQYAIWRYTDLTWDSDWNFETEDGRTAYWHLLEGANGSSGLTPDDFEVTVDVTAPSAPQVAGTLVGPFVVSTNQQTVAVSVDPALGVTDADGDPIDVAAVVDGQELYLDLRADAAAGDATVQVAAKGSSATGKIVSVPTVVGETPTAEDHAQTIILVAASTSTSEARADVSWAAKAVPAIGTSLVDSADGDRMLPWNGGTAIDTVSYENLTPGTEYTLVGELMRKSDGSATGITGTLTFTPTESQGSVDVSLAVPEGYAGEMLVAFERLYAGTDTTVAPVAVHEDIDDAAQTVTVEKEPSEEPTVPGETGEQPGGPAAPGDPAAPSDAGAVEAATQLPATGAEVPLAAIGAAGILILLGTLMMLRRRTQVAAG